MKKSKLIDHLQVFFFFIGILCFWQLIVSIFQVPHYLLPPPTKILTALVVKKHYLIENLIPTLIEILLGFFIGSLFGFILALCIASFRFLEKVLYPLIMLTQVTPKIAIAPLFIIWFGYGLLPKIVISALVCFFPVVVNVTKGLNHVHADLISLVHSLSATKKQILYKIRLPNSIPFLFSALKLSITLSVVGAIVGEFVGSDKGLGYVIMLANANFETDMVFASLAILCFIGIILFLSIGFIERKFFKNYNYS